MTYSESVFEALVIHHAMRMRHAVICGLSGCTMFFHIITQTARYLRERKIEYENVGCDFLYNICLQHFAL